MKTCLVLLMTLLTFNSAFAGSCKTSVWVARNNAPDWFLLNTDGSSTQESVKKGHWIDCFEEAIKRAKSFRKVTSLERVEHDSAFDYIDGVFNNATYRPKRQLVYVHWTFSGDFNGTLERLVSGSTVNGSGSVTADTGRCFALNKEKPFQKGRHLYQMHVEEDDSGEVYRRCSDFNHY